MYGLVTYQMIGYICHELGYTSSELQEQIGEYWMLFTAKEGYEDLLELAGDNLPDLLQNLNELHFRVKTLMPNLNPPRFEVSEQTENSLKLHYYSSRDGFTSFLVGVLKGATKKFDLNATIIVLPPVAPGEKSIISISWD